MTAATCSPGSHSHSDQPNWRPAETLDTYVANCREGLETYSDRHAARLLGASRAAVWRWKRMAELPDDLFEKLLTTSKRVPSTKALANVALALRGNDRADAECCPHCGGVVRVRNRVGAEFSQIVNEWLANGGAP